MRTEGDSWEITESVGTSRSHDDSWDTATCLGATAAMVAKVEAFDPETAAIFHHLRSYQAVRTHFRPALTSDDPRFTNKFVVATKA